MDRLVQLAGSFLEIWYKRNCLDSKPTEDAPRSREAAVEEDCLRGRAEPADEERAVRSGDAVGTGSLPDFAPALGEDRVPSSD